MKHCEIPGNQIVVLGLRFPRGPLQQEHLELLEDELLDPGETILWYQHSSKQSLATLFLIPAAVVLLVVVFVNRGNIEQMVFDRFGQPGAQPPAALRWGVRLGLLFVFGLVGAYMLWAGVTRTGKTTHYLITTHRAMLFRGTRNPDIWFLPLAQISTIVLQQHNEETATLELFNADAKHHAFSPQQECYPSRHGSGQALLMLKFARVQDFWEPYHMLRRACHRWKDPTWKETDPGPEPIQEPEQLAAVPQPLLQALAPHERVLWCGRPAGGYRFAWDALAGVLGTLMVLPLAVLVFFIFRQPGWWAGLGGFGQGMLLFLTVGLALPGAVWALFPQRRRWGWLRRFHYAVTNQRALVYREEKEPLFISIEHPVEEFECRMLAEDRGTLLLGPRPPGFWPRMGLCYSLLLEKLVVKFENIFPCQEVISLIIRCMAGVSPDADESGP